MLIIRRQFLPVDIAPLAVFRVIFGTVMLISMLRFMMSGWVESLYVEPAHHFPYYGFEWVKAPGKIGIWLLFSGVTLCAFLILLGCFYRLAITGFFLGFTYIELIDKTNYLNHYYFISLIAFLLLLLPANRAFSVDARIWPSLRSRKVPRWNINLLKWQLAMVYFFAGVAKLNTDWLLEAQPMRTWLPAHSDWFLIGTWMAKPWVAYLFSWAGALFDLSIPFLLWNKRTRVPAYFMVLVFHLLTWLLFPIGMFPFIMMASTLLFFPSSFHHRIIAFLSKRSYTLAKQFRYPVFLRLLLPPIVIVFLLLQMALPFRYLLYPDHLFWTEQGYRFSWRVMLMEKAGKAFFYVKDPEQKGEVEIHNSDFLTPNQEKMMATQPDMILQYAQILDKAYQKRGIADPEIRAEIWVSLNGKGSRLFIDPFIDLSKIEEGWSHKTWILPFDSVVTMDEFAELKNKNRR